MGDSVDEIGAACRDLRQAQASLLATMPQADVVRAVSEWATQWKDPRSAWRRSAETLPGPFPFDMTRLSLDALLDSLTPDALWALIDAEGVRDAHGVPLVGHVVAGNTPLLAWVSILRALLMRSASCVKLPSGGSGDWGRLFVRSLSETAPSLATCVRLAHWPGGTRAMDGALCRGVDLLLAYGSQATLRDLQTLCPPPARLLGYGHRVSFGIVRSGASFVAAAEGFARDILLYDQGGCLSPQTVFVQGPWQTTLDFAGVLADALREAVPHSPQASRPPQAAQRVQEARMLARMEADTVLREDRDLRWTVIARRRSGFAFSPTHGIVSVQPLGGPQDLPAAVAPCAGHLQGCAVSPGDSRTEDDRWHRTLEGLGVSRICRPGALQTPPFSWREDGRDVLRCLMPIRAA